MVEAMNSYLTGVEDVSETKSFVIYQLVAPQGLKSSLEISRTLLVPSNQERGRKLFVAHHKPNA